MSANPKPAPTAHFLEMYPDTFSRDFCETLIARFEADPRKEESRTAVRVNPKVRTGTMLSPQHISEWKDVIEEVERATYKNIEAYAEKYPSLMFLIKPENSYVTAPLMERIGPGQGYSFHIDAGPWGSHDRLLSTITYLRDVEEGGYTEFAFQNARVKPRAGAMLIFPPFWTHLHRGAPPVREVKYNLTNYLVLWPKDDPAQTTVS